MHEAVAVQESKEVAEGCVLHEVSPGYLYRGALLRAAKVIIAKESEESAETAPKA